jgi:MFS family permease
MVLLVLDSTIVGVLLPSMRADIGLGPGGQAWVVGTYLATLTVLMPVGGRLCDALGAARAFTVGMAGFSVASAGIGVSFSAGELIVWRGVAGVSAALLVPAGLAVLAEVYPADERAGALAVYTGVGQGFATVGPLVGGLCAQYAGWRWGFLINVPVGIGGLVLMAGARPLTPRRRGRELLALGLFRERAFAGASVVLFGLGWGMTVATVYGAATLQETLHLPPASAGAALLPLVIPLLVATRWAGRAAARVGARLLGMAGTLTLAAGLLGAAGGILSHQVVAVCLALVPTGVGIGLLMAPMTNAAFTAAPESSRGQASGLASTIRQLGGLAGVAGVGMLTSAMPHGPGDAAGARPVATGFVAACGLVAATAVIAARTLPRPIAGDRPGEQGAA